MSFEKYEVMKEFLKIADDNDLLGLKKEAAPAKNPHKEDDKVVVDKRKNEPEKSIIEEAHPEPVYVAEARGDGGLVENDIEQQKKLIEIVNKMPTGSLVGRYASAAVELIRMANKCDDIGHEEAADTLTDAALKLFAAPFDEDWDDPLMFDPEIEMLAEMSPLERKVWKAKKQGLDVCGVCGEEDCNLPEEECAKNHGYDVDEDLSMYPDRPPDEEDLPFEEAPGE